MTHGSLLEQDDFFALILFSSSFVFIYPLVALAFSLDTSLPSYRSLFPCQFPRGRATTSVFHQLGTGSISTITPLRQSFLTHAASKRNNTGLIVLSTFLFCARLLSQTVICRFKLLPDPQLSLLVAPLISTQLEDFPNTRAPISSGICSRYRRPCLCP